MASLTASSFAGTAMPFFNSKRSGLDEQPTVHTNALFGKLKRADKKEVERLKNLEVKKAGKLLPKNPKKMEQKPRKAEKMSNARNVPREGGFGGGGAYQKVKIGQKMEGTPVPSNIDPVFYAAGLIGVFVALSYALVSTNSG